MAPPETAPNVAPFLPPIAAPIAVAIPAVAAIIKASFSQDRRFPPPHNTMPAFIYTSRPKFCLLVEQAAFHVYFGLAEFVALAARDFKALRPPSRLKISR